MHETDTREAKPSLLRDLNERIAQLTQRDTKVLITALVVTAALLIGGGWVVVALMRLGGCLLLAGALYLLWRKGDVFGLFGEDQ